ncbi:MAG: FprA family A-type flavoprotein [Lachnospiraceae bacterium]|nr:FprA family A-type flavoprotein [Lachnospiraceae bacterium]
MNKNITNSVTYIGTDDHDIKLFESQYVVPNGMSYNSYLIKDDKCAVMDTVDSRKTDEWLVNLEQALNGRTPDYLVVQHMEPDHSGSIMAAVEKYPNMKLVGNAKTFVMMEQFFDIDFGDKKIVVQNGGSLELGKHTLNFVFAPMIHWPEVMVSYDAADKILFAADAFGKFGTLDTDEDWACEARRYYFNIVGKYGMQVQSLLKKAAELDIAVICPLHGPILSENLGYYIDKYNTWSSYEAEDKGILVAYASIHGNTAAAAEYFANMLREKGAEKVAVADLARDDMAEAIEDAFRYDRMVLAAASYDAGVFPCMEDFLNRLSHKGYKKRTVGIIENGTWAPTAARAMKSILETMKDITVCDNTITIKSAMKDSDIPNLEKLADELIK